MEKLRVILLQQLFKRWVVQRLKHIDLSAVPSWLGPRVPVTSRYQHSIGVGKLSLLVSGGTEHDRLLLTAAATLHDVGNGPFPHISDHLMREMLGFSHEGALEFAFQNSPVNDSVILEDYGLDIGEVAAVIKGVHRLSPFVNSSLDLDNADNVFRFMTNIPGRPLGVTSYHPSEIAASMSLETEKVEISEDLRRRWLRDREKIYNYIWEDQLNMICWTMLGRAMRILKEQITPMFFMMTNREAFHFIKLKVPRLASGLKEKRFKIIFDKKYRLLLGKAKKLSDTADLRKIEEDICKRAGLEEWSLGLTVDRPHIREKDDYWRVYLVVYEGSEESKALLKEILSDSVPYLN